MGEQERPKDVEVLVGVAGKPIMQQELNSLTRLLSTSSYDSLREERNAMPNFLNDGVIEKEFLSTGLGVMMAKRYFEDLKPEMEVRLQKVKGYRAYVHPHAPQISAEGLWARFSPQFLQRYKMLKTKSNDANIESFAAMSQLYLDQLMLPSDTIKQVLGMQQNQMGVTPDPLLAHADLSLFGFKSLSDWFGEGFVKLCAQTVLNMAQLAEMRGYAVSREEVRNELFQNIYAGYQQVVRQGNLDAEQAQNYYQMAMHAMGMDEPMLLNAWRKVMLCRLMLNDAGGSVLLDPLAFRQFESYAKESAIVDFYELPQELRFSDFRSMLKFQTYLEAVALAPQQLRNDLSLPFQFATVDAIEKRAPELVERTYSLEWTSTNVDELAGSISLKETWEWESQDANWEILKKNFTELAALPAKSAQAKMDALGSLDKKVRGKIDHFSRVKMVESDRKRIDLALQTAPTASQEMGIRSKGGTFAFDGVKERSELIALLEKASLQGTAPNTEAQKLQNYSADGKNYYRIAVLKRDSNKSVIPFATALREGTLDPILDVRLEAGYPDARKKSPQLFMHASGQIKPFHEAKDAIGKIVFVDLLKTIEDKYRAYYGFLPGVEGDLPLHFYSNARLLTHAAKAMEQLASGSRDPKWLKREASASHHLDEQWSLAVQERRIERCAELAVSKEALFATLPNEWSPVQIGERGAIAFYRARAHEASSGKPVESMEMGHQILSMDAKRDFMQRLLGEMEIKKAIDLSLKNPEVTR
ncbi:MAG: hypothetical protein V4492_04335, partial [Chlamydiota bacterium]